MPPADASALASTRTGAEATRYRNAALTELIVKPTVAKPKTSDRAERGIASSCSIGRKSTLKE
jgi:hypothetical protein